MRLLPFLAVAAMTGCAREHTVVVLSTNDIHARIQYFPQLAAAVGACRDTATVILVDAGDRWTGNAYVDLAEDRRPILDLMGRLGYDAATVGNHEFDGGQGLVGRMFRIAEFPVVCANLVSDTSAVETPDPYVVVERNGVKFGFAGVVTNYEGDRTPAGQKAVYVGLRFPDPKEAAAAVLPDLAAGSDVQVLLSHMGSDHDRIFLEGNTGYDLVIGGHSHEEIVETVNGTPLTQTGKNLANIGVAVFRMKGRRIESIETRLVPLSGYAPDPEYKRLVDAYHADPELNAPVGAMKATADKVGLANLMSRLLAGATGAEVAFYHIGGVRLDSLEAGGVSKAAVLNLEPFGTRVVTASMTPAQMREMIVSKFNDPVNVKEGRRVDLFSTTPYEIVTDSLFRAVDVRFPKLREGRAYRVAMTDYIFKVYKDLHYDDPQQTELLVGDLVTAELESRSPLVPDNVPYQSIR